MTGTPAEVPDLPDFCWPVDTSCVPLWDALEDPTQPAGPDNPPLYSEADKARAVSLAGQTLRMLTGFRVGGCPVTVRPASRGCTEQTWRTYPVDGGGSTPWQPVSLGGRWLNIGCGHARSGCGCLSTREVTLHGTVGAIVAVKVDGMTLDPTAYRLDRGGRLVRLDGDGWPLCQDLAAPDDAEGTWSVTYVPGAPVDGIGAWVAGLLAGEYVKACTSGECRLPTGVTQVVRQGVTLTLGTGTFPGGRTGIREVDAYLERWNPNGLRSAPQVYSPDVRRGRIQA